MCPAPSLSNVQISRYAGVQLMPTLRLGPAVSPKDKQKRPCLLWLFRGVGCYLITDVSEQLIASIFFDCFLDDGAGVIFRNEGNQLPTYAAYHSEEGRLLLTAVRRNS